MNELLPTANDAYIQKGMALLDEKLGLNWVYAIDLDTLKLSSTCLCVVGQLFGPNSDLTVEIDLNDDDPFGAGIKYLGLDSGYNSEGLPDPGNEAIDYGFDLAATSWSRNISWDSLTYDWKQAIIARRAQLDTAVPPSA